MAYEANNIHEPLLLDSDVEEEVPVEDNKNTGTMDDENVKKKKAEEEENVECRFCHQEDLITFMEAPCFCNGTLKYVHRACIQRWCNAKGNIICEICHQPFQPNYTVANNNIAINPRARIRFQTPRPERQFIIIYLNDESRYRSLMYGAGIILCVALYFLLLARERSFSL